MSLSVLAGQITALGGAAPKAARRRATSARAESSFREKLRNHHTQCGTTIKGRAAIVFGGAFVAMGVFIMLVATGVIPTEEGAVHAPMWVIGTCAGVFGLPGLWVVWYGIRTSIADAWVRRRSERFPDSPCYFDYPWNESGSTYSDLRSIRRSMMFVLILGGLAVPGHQIALEEGSDAWFLWIGMGFLDLFLLLGVYFVCRATLRLVRFGRSRLRFDRFPFRLGQRMNVTWLRPRGMKRCGTMHCTLRCIEEVFESAGEEGGQTVQAYAIYRDEKTIEPPMDRNTTFAEVALAFDLPKGEFETRLRNHPPRYWELEIRVASVGVDYEARFLAPVYA